jgi:alanyl aminopeptidase
MFLSLRYFLGVLSTLTATGLVLGAAGQPPQLRLPETASPTSYRAQLEINPDETSFKGHIIIELETKEPLQTLWLNANDLSISQARLVTKSKTIEIHTVPGGEDFVGLQSDSVLPAGKAELDMAYTGHFRLHDSSGVFRMEEDGNRYVFTQFEETDARAAFPCFDEPSYKVPWQLTLTIPKKYEAVSNTPIEQQKADGNRKVLRFARTKPLPSYLIAFAVGQFDFVPAGFAGRNRVPVRIVAPKGHASEAKYATQVTATIQSRLEEYFDIPYPYEKSDQVAIPVTFGFGAMENAGMVTYAQNLLLASPDRDTIHRQREYASVAAHELAHQWFGDLVTTAWWNDIWLNEAFATWMEQKILAEWKPEWQTRVDDVNSKLEAEHEDTLISARKIRQEIKTKDDISNAFDEITYQKGAAVIGMFENWVGAPDFRKGVRAYLNKYAFRNANATEFLEAISSVTKKSVTAPFGSFLNQAGVPLISISLDCNGTSPTLHFQQQRSLAASAKVPESQIWQIPVCIRYENGGSTQSSCSLLSDPRSDLALKAQSCPTWVQANDNAVGYYRVAYSNALRAGLTSGNVQQKLSAAERVDLMGDSQALSRTGKMSEGDTLRLVTIFHDDTNRYVLERAITMAKNPLEHLVPDELMPNYRRFVLQNFQNRAREIGWMPQVLTTSLAEPVVPAGESDDIRLVRSALLEFVSTDGGDEELARGARELTEKWFADRRALPADETEAVLETAAYYGDKGLFDRFLTEFKQTEDSQEHKLILHTLESFRDPAAIQTGMQAVLHADIPFMQGERLLYSGQHWPSTRKLAFNFMKDHFDELAAKRPNGGGSDAGAQFSRVGASFCDSESEDELKNFFEPRVSKFVGAPRVLAQTLEGIKSCIANKAAQEPSVEQFLKEY